MTKTSSWTVLQNPVFRKLWIASLISGTCVAAHDTAATWMMNTLSPSASELWVAAQRAMPSWARGRMNATIIMVSQGAMALGGVISGCAATKAGASYTLLGAAILFLISLSLAAPLSINFTGRLNFDPAPITSFSHRLVYTPQPYDGPMSITVEFKIDCARGREFLSLMRDVRLIHLRNGAYSWRLHEAPTLFV